MILSNGAHARFFPVPVLSLENTARSFEYRVQINH